MRRGLPAAALCAALIAGCAPPKEITKERTLGLPDVVSRVRERNDRIRTLKGEGLITLESPEGSTSGSFDSFLRKPDSLRLEFHGPFGIHIGTLTLSRDKFLFYNSRDNTAIIGKPDGRTLQSAISVHMSLQEIIRAFTGEFAPGAEGDSLTQFRVQDAVYVLTYRSGPVTKEFRVDGDSFVVVSYRELEPDGKPAVTALASRVVDHDGVAMPTILRVIFPRERRSVSIAYDGLGVNADVACSFTPPATAERIYR